MTRHTRTIPIPRAVVAQLPFKKTFFKKIRLNEPKFWFSGYKKIYGARVRGRR
jgi:hypothetical protein